MAPAKLLEMKIKKTTFQSPFPIGIHDFYTLPAQVSIILLILAIDYLLKPSKL